MPSFGWIPNPPDPRDYQITTWIPTLRVMPMVKSNICPPVRDQGNLGSCVSHAFLSLMEAEEIRRGDDFLEDFSRRFAYQRYNEVINGNPTTDQGCMPRLAVKLLQRDGVCMESTVPYRDYGQQMPQKAFQEALDNQVIEYYTITGESQKLSVLASDYCWACGVAVFQSFVDAPKGQVPMPDYATEDLLGYHMIFIYGYDRHRSLYLWQNSWGEDWGDVGRGTIPFAYLHDPYLASDFTVIRSIE